MKKVLLFLMVFLLIASVSFAGGKNYTRIKDGTLTYSSGHFLEGEAIPLGYDEYGYNYNAHLFKGSYANAYLGKYGFPPYNGNDDEYLDENPDVAETWVWPYRNDKLIMKWNDAWLANKDKDKDGLLDRHYGLDNYIDSGAWLTNHIVEADGNKYFCKIVAAPEDAYKDSGVWYTSEGSEIGPSIWGQFIIIQEVEDEESTFASPYKAGLGNW